MRVTWIEIYEELIRLIEIHDPKRKFKFHSNIALKFQNLIEKLKDYFVREKVGSEINKSKYWISVFKNEVKKLNKSLYQGVLLPKEFRDFVADPRCHLRKKLFNYTYDLLRGKLNLEEYERKCEAAIKTSLRTNMRTAYQLWAILALINNLNSLYNVHAIYPEHGYILLTRAGMQKANSIPPNSILFIEGRGYLSIFLEAPRPIGWSDTGDLSAVWKLYTAMRPDMLVYGGKIMDIVDLNSNPPILRPDVIIEFKELEDWYKRGRMVKGPLARPLSAEEWRSRWIEGLWDGLAEAMGVERAEAIKKVEEGKGVRLNEIQLVSLYASVYKPDAMFLVTRARTPSSIKKELMNKNIEVIDNVRFNHERLKPLATKLLEFSKYKGVETQVITIDYEILNMLTKLQKELLNEGYNLTDRDILKAIIKFALMNKSNLKNLLIS